MTNADKRVGVLNRIAEAVHFLTLLGVIALIILSTYRFNVYQKDAAESRMILCNDPQLKSSEYCTRAREGQLPVQLRDR